ncbi:hypothetical protein [Nonomuraea glycinis]|uniref:hypothetical protein n=1 Tax=Nonomuraea glycinis TaxID=2047744 RepID=UPI002E0FA0B2|nr:hypothetical protein OHA68_43270 [Nonomuraea glycinis]
MDKSTTPALDPATLTPTQLDGIACVHCHAEDNAMRPVGTIPTYGQVFACLTHDDQPADPATALQAMRDTLGVDQITGLSLADAVKVGMTLGAMLKADDGGTYPAEVTAAFYKQEISDREHRIFAEAVVEVLSLRAGLESSRTKETMLGYHFGYLSFAHLAEEFGTQPTTLTLKQVGEHFTAAEMAELMATLDRVIARRRGEVPASWAPVAVLYDADGRCGDASCITCSKQVSA